MAKKRPKYLIETSAVRAKVGPTTAAHRGAFDEFTGTSRLYTSAYIRMEYIRRWVCSSIVVATTISRFRDVSEAMVYLEQSFSPREVKSYLACIAEWLAACGTAGNNEASAEEVARTAFHMVRRFDKIFPARTQNRSRCKRGGKSISVDSFASIADDLAAFHEEFSTPVTDCEVQQFLKLQDPRSPANELLCSVPETDVACMKHLKRYASQDLHITCKECERIGDVLIALEQTATYTLVHVDKSFNSLCECRDLPHHLLPSVRGAEKLAEDQNQ